MRKYFKLLTAAIMSLLITQAVWAAAQTQMDIVGVAMHDKNLTTLVKALKAADLVDTLKGTGPYTVFAPTNAAFKKLPKGTLDKLLKDKTQLVAVLTYHVVPGKVLASDVQNGPMNTVQGQPVTLDKTGNTVRVNNAKVVKADKMASNGVIHEIDVVLMPTQATTPSTTTTTPTTPVTAPATTPGTTGTTPSNTLTSPSVSPTTAPPATTTPTNQ